MGLKAFLWHKLFYKALKSGLGTFVAAFGAHLASVGITVDQAVLVGALTAGLEGLRNWLKHEKGWGWL